MFIDLNKFKIINDTYGHEAGNAVLKEIAKRLRHTLRDSDLIARYAGDEFVVYMDCGQADVTEDLCMQVAEKIIRSVERPINIGNREVEISLSIGIALYPDAGNTFEILLKNADEAMYEAKNSNNKKYQIIKDNNAVKKEPQKKKINKYNYELADFSDAVAHDLKAPMRKIMSYCQLLSNDQIVKKNVSLQSYINRMDISAARMQNLIESLLSYAQISYFSEEKENFDLANIVEKAIEDLGTLITEKQASIFTEDLPEWPVYITKFEQVMSNIISNSIKYPHKDRHPIIEISGYVSDDYQCHILIKDNGQGIPKQYKHRILKPFQRLHRADDIEGSGFGLPICMKAVEAHGGELKIHSTEGVGTTIEITLPK